MDDISKVAKLFSRKKRTKRAPSWRTKFASSVKSKVEENNLGDRMAMGFARIMSRKGF